MYVSFSNASHEEQFTTKGYVILRSLLQPHEVSQLSSFFIEHRSKYIGFFSTTHFNTDTEYKKLVHDTIANLVFPKVRSYLNSFIPLFGNFMIKNPDPQNAMDLHADWTYVDESFFNSISIWIPLIDVNEQNGCLGIIEESHKVTNSIRGPLIRQTQRIHEPQWIKKYGKLLPMNAGDAILYNHALLHYSPPNKTETIRPAINLSVAPSRAPVVHYCMPEGSSEIEVYSVPDTDFFVHYNHFQRPEKGMLIKKISSSEIKYMDERMKWFKLKLFAHKHVLTRF